jgi:BspA type Leucine rich repeat region (6 copies)
MHPSLTPIGNSVCREQEYVIFAADVTATPEHAFQSSLLKEVVVPDTATAIGQFAFSGCKFISSVIIGRRATIADRGALTLFGQFSKRQLVLGKT